MSTAFEEAISRFVATVRAHPNGARRKDLPPADRKNDSVRQAARKRGLVEYAERAGTVGKRWYVIDTGEPKS